MGGKHSVPSPWLVHLPAGHDLQLVWPSTFGVARPAAQMMQERASLVAEYVPDERENRRRRRFSPAVEGDKGKQQAGAGRRREAGESGGEL